MGKAGRSGRKPERFCKLGHDKFAPHGGYVRKDSNGYEYLICAICSRTLNNKWWIERYGSKKRAKSEQNRVQDKSA